MQVLEFQLKVQEYTITGKTPFYIKTFIFTNNTTLLFVYQKDKCKRNEIQQQGFRAFLVPCWPPTCKMSRCFVRYAPLVWVHAYAMGMGLILMRIFAGV